MMDMDSVYENPGSCLELIKAKPGAVVDCGVYHHGCSDLVNVTIIEFVNSKTIVHPKAIQDFKEMGYCLPTKPPSRPLLEYYNETIDCIWIEI